MNTIISYFIVAIFYIFLSLQPDKYYKNLYNTKCCHYLHDLSFSEHDTFNVNKHILIPFIFLFPTILFLSNQIPNFFKLLLPLFIADIIVHLFKTFINKPRPDIIQRIDYLYNKIYFNNSQNNVSINHKINAIKNSKYQSELLDGYKSFISGHTSYVFSVLFIIGYVIFFNNSRAMYPINHYLLLIIFIVYFMYAILCCESRLSDNKHHHIDIIAGILNGLIIPFIVLL